MEETVLIDVGKELAEHYKKVLDTQEEILSDGPTGSEAAAVLNATTRIIQQMAAIQQDLYNSRRIAVLQQAIVEALADADIEVRNRVLDLMEEKLSRLE